MLSPGGTSENSPTVSSHRLYGRLAADLHLRGVKGCGERMLQQMAVFYRLYPEVGRLIPQSAIAEFMEGLPKLSIRQSVIAEFAKPRPTKDIGKSTSLMSESSPGLTRSSAFSPIAESPSVTPFSPRILLRFSWTQFLELIRLDDPIKRAFYENECLKGNWSVRQLQRQIGSLLYERTGLSTNKTAVVKRAHRQERQATIEDFIRDPYVLEFTGLADRPEFHEGALEKALLDDLQAFLLELGTGFCFEARQFRVTVGNDHDYLDLVFYHRLLRCHVLLDLKVRAFRHADAGQMNYYVNYFKNRVMAPGDNPPVGIILCSDRDQTKVEFATAGMDNNLFVSRYLVSLPTTEQLSRFVEQDRARFEALVEQEKPRLRRSKG